MNSVNVKKKPEEGYKEEGNSRIVNLKERFLRDKFFVDSERALLITESYKETEGEPNVLLRAKGLKKILENISTPIHDHELVVGSQNGSSSRSANVFPEMSGEWLEKELDGLPNRSVDPFQVPDKVRKDLTEKVIPYWKGKTMETYLLNYLPPETKRQQLANHPAIFGWCACRNGMGHVILGFENVLKNGFNGIKAEAEKKLQEMDWSEPESVNKEFFYRAVCIVCDAAVTFGRRYAEKARELAQKEENEKRRQELETIAEICTRVPGNPPETFYEAIQTMWFVSLIAQIETNGVSIAPGRFDQYMYPYYLKDIKRGVTEGEVLELIECYYIKLSEMVILYDEEMATYIANFSMGQNITLGGITKDGKDATNELSYLCLRAMREVSLIQPNLNVRWHDGTPQDFALEVARTIRSTNAFPEIMNDKVVIPAILDRGITLEEARDWALVGCIEVSIPGGKMSGLLIGVISAPKIMELALNNGKCRICGNQMGPKTGDPKTFSKFDDILEAMREQWKFFAKQAYVLIQAEEIVHSKFMQIPFASATMYDCLESGKDMSEGGCRYNIWNPTFSTGVGTIADSLAAIKKYVFDEKKITMSEYIDALDKNFEGKDELLRMIAKAPKFGNDDDYVDSIIQRVVNIYYDEVLKYKKDFRGSKCLPTWPGISSITQNIPLGHATGATPDGRLSGTPVSEDMSPTQGKDTSGVTASMRSVAKIDTTRAAGGVIYNLKISPSALKGEENLKRFVDLNRAYMDEGGQQVQYNIISTDTLRAAQKDPEKYKFLLVRVAGYSALFVELSREVQDDIISRYEHSSI